jgi:hypothetical protein
MANMRKAALKAWETRRKNDAFLKMMKAAAGIYDELMRFGPTDEGVEGAMDTLVSAFHEARYAFGVQDKVDFKQRKRS